MTNDNNLHKKEIEAQRGELLRTSRTDDTRIHKLEFSDYWYRQVRYYPGGSPWLQVAPTIDELQRKQTRQDKRIEPKKFVQIGFFDKGEW